MKRESDKAAKENEEPKNASKPANPPPNAKKETVKQVKTTVVASETSVTTANPEALATVPPTTTKPAPAAEKSASASTNSSLVTERPAAAEGKTMPEADVTNPLEEAKTTTRDYMLYVRIGPGPNATEKSTEISNDAAAAK